MRGNIFAFCWPSIPWAGMVVCMEYALYAISAHPHLMYMPCYCVAYAPSPSSLPPHQGDIHHLVPHHVVNGQLAPSKWHLADDFQHLEWVKQDVPHGLESQHEACGTHMKEWFWHKIARGQRPSRILCQNYIRYGIFISMLQETYIMADYVMITNISSLYLPHNVGFKRALSTFS